MVAARVDDAWQLQMQRLGVANSRLDGDALKHACALDDDCWSLLETATVRFNLSARAQQRGGHGKHGQSRLGFLTYFFMTGNWGDCIAPVTWDD